MRFLSLLCLIVLSFIVSCSNQQKNPDPPTAGNDTSEVVAPMPKENSFENTMPYPAKEIAALLPLQIEGGSLSEPDSGEIMGTHYAKGLYTINDSTAIELSLFDCAGSGGAGFYQFQFLNMLTAAPESEDVEKKTIDFKGQKAIQQFDNNSYRSTFTYPSGRLLVTLESEALDTEGLKKVAEKLSFQ